MDAGLPGADTQRGSCLSETRGSSSGGLDVAFYSQEASVNFLPREASVDFLTVLVTQLPFPYLRQPSHEAAVEQAFAGNLYL